MNLEAQVKSGSGGIGRYGIFSADIFGKLFLEFYNLRAVADPAAIKNL